MNFDKNVKEYSDECSERNKNKEVVFAADPPADNSKCKRYSTAKYDRRTRQKIREKIRLENFVFEQLRLLYNTEVDDYDCDIDMDEICALQTNEEKVFKLKEKLRSCPAKQDQIDLHWFRLVFVYLNISKSPCSQINTHSYCEYVKVSLQLCIYLFLQYS
ncbi:unnamed protein product [Trichobilharzia szidati]|nr:unnamed protein product [Trichobilharzia szidati]